MYLSGRTTTEKMPVSGETVTVKRLWFPTVADQLLFLRRLIKQWRALQWCRDMAHDIVFSQAHCQPKDQIAHAIAIAQWVQDRIHYVNELPETFQTPIRTVKNGFGDCDDFTTLIGSLCEAIGIPITVVGMQLDREWVHVFPEAQIGGQRIPLDATLTGPMSAIPDPIGQSLAAGHRVHTLRL